MWLNCHVGAWALPKMAPTLHQCAYVNAYTNWRAGLSPEVMATIALAKRALFAFQDLPGAWLLIGLDRMDNHNPFVFAVDPKLGHNERMRAILLDDFVSLWGLPRDTWTQMELLHPSAALAWNSGVHTRYNLVSALQPTHINGWCTRSFGETIINVGLHSSSIRSAARQPP